MPRVWKQVISPVSYWIKDKVRTFSKPELEHFARTGKKMLAKGLPLYAPLEHQSWADPPPLGPTDPDERRAKETEYNRGFLRDFKIDDLGALWTEIEIADEKFADHAAKNIKFVSPRIRREFTDADGDKWENFISHVAFTPNPVDFRQAPFGTPLPAGAKDVAMSAWSQGEEFLELSVLNQVQEKDGQWDWSATEAGLSGVAGFGHYARPHVFPGANVSVQSVLRHPDNKASEEAKHSFHSSMAAHHEDRTRHYHGQGNNGSLGQAHEAAAAHHREMALRHSDAYGNELIRRHQAGDFHAAAAVHPDTYKDMSAEEDSPHRYSGAGGGAAAAKHFGIQNPSSTGHQGHTELHASNPHHATIVGAGYKYSHSTPIGHPDGSYSVHHTYTHSANINERVSVGGKSGNEWSIGRGGSARHISGTKTQDLEKSLKTRAKSINMSADQEPQKPGDKSIEENERDTEEPAADTTTTDTTGDTDQAHFEKARELLKREPICIILPEDCDPCTGWKDLHTALLNKVESPDDEDNLDRQPAREEPMTVAMSATEQELAARLSKAETRAARVTRKNLKEEIAGHYRRGAISRATAEKLYGAIDGATDMSMADDGSADMARLEAQLQIIRDIPDTAFGDLRKRQTDGKPPEPAKVDFSALDEVERPSYDDLSQGEQQKGALKDLIGYANQHAAAVNGNGTK